MDTEISILDGTPKIPNPLSQFRGLIRIRFHSTHFPFYRSTFIVDRMNGRGGGGKIYVTPLKGDSESFSSPIETIYETPPFYKGTFQQPPKVKGGLIF